MIELLQCEKRHVILSLEGGESHEEQKEPGCGRSQKGCRTRTAQRRKPDNLFEYLPAKGTCCTKALQEQQVMATALAEAIVRRLIASSVVEEVDRELYVYGFFLLITRVSFFLVAAAIGCLLGVPGEGIVFYIVFILLRSYAGGVHAKTEVACTVLTTLSIGISVAMIKMLELSDRGMIPLLIAANICILLFSPLDTPQKPLDAAEREWYRRKCCGLLAACNLMMFLFAVMGLRSFCCSVLYGMCLEAVLLSAGKIYNRNL